LADALPDFDAEPALNALAINALIAHGYTIAVAESLTGGQLVASLVDVAGASAAVVGGVVAYATPVKYSALGVSAELLAEKGAVDPEVARQMATGVRVACAVDGRPADVGIATTGVAGPEEQDGKPVGTVFVGIAIEDRVDAVELSLSGTRRDIQSATVREALELLVRRLTESRE
jgi:nicotinamide-nucleotide amidase